MMFEVLLPLALHLGLTPDGLGDVGGIKLQSATYKTNTLTIAPSH